MTALGPNITSDFGVSGALGPDGYRMAAAQGFRSIISFLPDGETADGSTAAAAEARAAACGLAFAHVPAAKYDLFSPAVVEGARAALKRLPTPILGVCSSGQRAAIVWAAAQTEILPVDEILARLSAAGFELSVLRDDLETQAHLAQLATSALAA